MKNTSSLGWLLIHVCLVLACAPVFAQAKPAADDKRQLSDTITQMDAKTFAAFNKHDLDGLMAIFARDVEFYHDKGGLTNYDQTRNGFRTMFANMPDIRRDMVGSLEVYPIKDFGAIEVGTHRFCHKENGMNDCGEFPFVMIWKKDAPTWKISRVVSYGH